MLLAGLMTLLGAALCVGGWSGCVGGMPRFSMV